MKVLKKVKINWMMPLIMGLILLLSTHLYAADLEKGKYTISNNVIHDNPVGQGMARSYTESTSNLRVTSEGNFISIGFNNTHFMGNFSIKINGKDISYDTIAHDPQNNIKKLEFKLPSLSTKVTVGLYVIPMDTQVEYEVSFDESTLKLIEKAEEVVATPAPTIAPVVEKPIPTVAPKPSEKPVAPVVNTGIQNEVQKEAQNEASSKTSKEEKTSNKKEEAAPTVEEETGDASKNQVIEEVSTPVVIVDENKTDEENLKTQDENAETKNENTETPNQDADSIKEELVKEDSASGETESIDAISSATVPQEQVIGIVLAMVAVTAIIAGSIFVYLRKKK